MAKEALARVKINRKLEAAGWRFLPDADGPANIRLEPNVPLRPADLQSLGDDFQFPANLPARKGRGFIDFLLLDSDGKPLIVLEAKSEEIDPLSGKEQARGYAESQRCRFVILSNGEEHYLWDIQGGNPQPIVDFPTPTSALFTPSPPNSPQRLVDHPVRDDFIVLVQCPGYASEAAWLNETERPRFIEDHGLRFLRGYQLNAIHALQRAVAQGDERFLFEMATGTGKTLTAAAAVILFLRTRNAKRVLFLVDRLELETQAKNAFDKLLKNDFTSAIYKDRRHDWRSADIVVSTVQSLLFNNNYRSLFSPDNFDLVISDEAHRSISGSARGVFDYFHGYKLGLTATPKDYLRGAGSETDPRELERRALRDTYQTFGCDSGEPTFRYSLLDGVRDAVLVSPTVIDARTDITTQMLSEQGFVVSFIDEQTGKEVEQSFSLPEYEKRFFSQASNRIFCRTFLEHALRDPVTGEIGKSIVFAVSQNHAARIAQILNEEAEILFPGRYRSDFALQVTSNVRDAQEFTRQFANNNLMGSSNFRHGYKTSKTRICVTVGMMTTGYDCPDLLNLALFRPVFSPTEFVQIKGRGTRPHNFAPHPLPPAPKTTFKLFDFFAVCEYFETEFNYDEKLELPATPGETIDDPGDGGPDAPYAYTHLGGDAVRTLREQTIGPSGMLIDRKLFNNETSFSVQTAIDRDKRLEEECAKFLRLHPPADLASVPLIKNFFKACVMSAPLREILASRAYAQLAANPGFTLDDLRTVPESFRSLVPHYINRNVPLDDFAA